MIATCHTPACSGVELPFLSAKDENQRASQELFQYVRCPSCGLIRLSNPPSDLDKYYPNDYYNIPSAERLNELARKDDFKIGMLRRHSQGGRLLEIGPAWGTFALQAKQSGFEVDVIEMDPRCCEYLNKTVGVRAICSNAPHEAIQTLLPYDVIALWQVIEHIAAPWSLLKAVAINLKPDGLLILATPNPDAWQFRMLGSKWPHIDAPRHLYLFPADLLISYCAALGLELVERSMVDRDARSWNRFGWQRLLMNRVTGKWLTRLAFVLGYGISWLFSPIENREPNASSYTLILRKNTQ